MDHPTLNPAAASRLANLALASIHREYPHKLDHVMASDADARPPRELHPAFHGCYDWHSAVHAHWLLARVVRACPDLPERERIIRSLIRNLAADNIAAEIDYLHRPDSRAFERTYGWAWLLKLHEELTRAVDPGVGCLADTLGPLAAVFANRYLAYLPRVTYPIRTGVHPNTAFGLWFALDWAEHTRHHALRQLVVNNARRLFECDTNYPAHLEPSGSDFFSPALIQAALMSRILPASGFAGWFAAFLPGVASAQPACLVTPATISDRTDPQIVHLDGLNLSRTWCMRTIAGALGPSASVNPSNAALSTAAVLLTSANLHLAASLPHITSGDYVGEHWLGTFALLAMLGER